MLNIYIDMDGVLAKWNPVPEAVTHEKGYFRKREVEPVIQLLIQKIQQEGQFPITILTAAYDDDHSASDKLWWLKHVTKLTVPVIIVPYGRDKADFVSPGKNNILIDDFSKNLFAWEAKGNTSIKFRNGFNGRNGTWKGRCIERSMTLGEVLDILRSIEKESEH